MAPIVPEIYLDESSCEEGEITNYTWTTKNALFRVHGRGSKFIILGAGVVFKNDTGEVGGFPELRCKFAERFYRVETCFAMEYAFDQTMQSVVRNNTSAPTHTAQLTESISP